MMQQGPSPQRKPGDFAGIGSERSAFSRATPPQGWNHFGTQPLQPPAPVSQMASQYTPPPQTTAPLGAFTPGMPDFSGQSWENRMRSAFANSGGQLGAYGAFGGAAPFNRFLTR